MLKNDNIHKNEEKDIRRNWTFVVQLVISGKVQYRIWNPHRISKSKKKIYLNRSINKEIGHLWPESDLRESTISDLESPSNFQVKEKKIIEIGPEITKFLHFCIL